MQWLNYGSDSATFTITPDRDYYVADVKVDGVSKGGVRALKLTGVRSSHKVVASFALKRVTRLPGDRYANALSMARASYPKWKGVKHVVIASGMDETQAYFEAATAPGLAGAYNAPLLLLPRSSLRSDVRAALKQMPDGLKVHIVGGKGGVSSSGGVFHQGRSGGRFSRPCIRSRQVRHCGSRGAQDEDGAGLQVPECGADRRRLDTISNIVEADIASVAAARTHMPLLYVQVDTVPAATSSALAGTRSQQRYIVGNTSEVSAIVQAALAVAPSDRLAGLDHAETAAEFATRARAEGWLSSRRVGFFSYPQDATGAGAYLGLRNAPLLVVQPSSIPASTARYLTATKQDTAGGYVFGPKPSVS